MKALMTIIAMFIATSSFAETKQNVNLPKELYNDIVVIANNCHYQIETLDNGELSFVILNINEGESDLFISGFNSKTKEITFTSVRCEFTIFYESLEYFMKDYIISLYSKSYIEGGYVPNWFIQMVKQNE